ncbi:MAG TPA: Crp/Fnr family transcriptional regulator [Clostridiaceae bacterium]
MKIDFFKSLNISEEDFLNKNMNIKSFDKGEIIFNTEDICSSLAVVINGELRLMKYPTENQEYILEILKEGDVFGEAILFDNTNYPVFVIASKKTQIGFIAKESIIHLMEVNADFMEAYLNVLCSKIKNLNFKIDMLTQTNIKGRILKYLSTLKKEQGIDRVELNMTKQTMALLLGTSREVLSRNFSELEREGYIKQTKDFIEIYTDEI